METLDNADVMLQAAPRRCAGPDSEATVLYFQFPFPFCDSPVPAAEFHAERLSRGGREPDVASGRRKTVPGQQKARQIFTRRGCPLPFPTLLRE